ncbi:tRNA (adenosine(37)-N6)-dimethylallyltransferase MiaA [soil metagenome]
MPRPILIAGPTASGKSRLAIELARRFRGVVVNVDSMQVYRELRILTARPTAEDEAEVPHRLYGHVPAGERYSVGRWLGDLAETLAEARTDGLRPIIVGGTGLYFTALTRGLAAVPPIPAEVRATLRGQSEGVASAELHARLAAIDGEGAATTRPSDRTRILRALEVFTATGRSLPEWKRAAAAPPLIDPATAAKVVLSPDRALLHQRIAERAGHMIRAGALAEVDALARLGLDPELPAMKAIGVRELIGHNAGKLSIDEALAAIRTETRRYAKRQMTWFRGQMPDWPVVEDDEAALRAFA